MIASVPFLLPLAAMVPSSGVPPLTYRVSKV